MPEDIVRLLKEIGAATSVDELAAIASIAGDIDESYDEATIARVIDALREARERLELVPQPRAAALTSLMRARRPKNDEDH